MCSRGVRRFVENVMGLRTTLVQSFCLFFEFCILLFSKPKANQTKPNLIQSKPKPEPSQTTKQTQTNPAPAIVEKKIMPIMRMFAMPT